MTAGHDLNYIGLSGALWYSSAPGSPPMTPATLVGDIGGGAMYLIAGILAGLLKAGRTGQGTVVDAAIVDGSAHMMALLMSMAPMGHLQEERGQSLLDGPHWCRIYKCADGKWIAVQCLEAQFYACFLDAMGLSNAPEFQSQYDSALWPDQTERLSEVFLSQTREYWLSKTDGTDACVAPVLSPQDAKNDPHMAARGVWQTHADVLQPAPAPRFDNDSAEIMAPPERGQHSDDIIHELKADGFLS